MNLNATMLWNAEIFAGNICTKPEKTGLGTVQGAILSHFSFFVVYFEQFSILWVVSLPTPLKTYWKFYDIFHTEGASQSRMLNAVMGRETYLFCRESNRENDLLKSLQEIHGRSGKTCSWLPC